MEEYNIKVNRRGIGCKDVEWTNLAWNNVTSDCFETDNGYSVFMKGSKIVSRGILFHGFSYYQTVIKK